MKVTLRKDRPDTARTFFNGLLEVDPVVTTIMVFFLLVRYAVATFIGALCGYPLIGLALAVFLDAHNILTPTFNDPE